MDEVPIEAISITPENAEYQIDDQDKAEIMLNLLPKLDDGMLNCVFKVNTCEPIEMFSLNKFAFLFSIYLFIYFLIPSLAQKEFSSYKDLNQVLKLYGIVISYGINISDFRDLPKFEPRKFNTFDSKLKFFNLVVLKIDFKFYN